MHSFSVYLSCILCHIISFYPIFPALPVTASTCARSPQVRLPTHFFSGLRTIVLVVLVPSITTLVTMIFPRRRSVYLTGISLYNTPAWIIAMNLRPFLRVVFADLIWPCVTYYSAPQIHSSKGLERVLCFKLCMFFTSHANPTNECREQLSISSYICPLGTRAQMHSRLPSRSGTAHSGQVPPESALD